MGSPNESNIMIASGWLEEHPTEKWNVYAQKPFLYIPYLYIKHIFAKLPTNHKDSLNWMFDGSNDAVWIKEMHFVSDIHWHEITFRGLFSGSPGAKFPVCQ